MSRNDDEVAKEIAAHHRPRRANPLIEVPRWFIGILVLLALAPTLLVIVYAIAIG